MKPTAFIAASFAALSGMVFLGTGVAQATDITGTISITLTISANSRLTGDVSCKVTGAPCIKSGAPGIELKLNGHSMTGNGGKNSCTLNFAETGIDTNSKNNVSIEGPGLVRRFNGIGIVVSGNNSSVEGVAVTSICGDGIRVLGSQNEVEGNSISRASLGGFFAGIFLSAPGGHNSILHNESNGGFGIIVGFTSKNNLIQGNNASGEIFIDVGSIGNTIRNNQALTGAFFDIFDNNALPANTYDNNLLRAVSNWGPARGKRHLQGSKHRGA